MLPIEPMTTKTRLEGVLAASLTPMNSDLTIDHHRLVSHCGWLLDNGCDGLALMGTTGEANSLSVAERMIALDAVLDSGISPQKLIVGTGCAALPDTLSLTRHAVARGVHGILLLPPFYYKHVTDDGVFASVDAVIQRVGDTNLQIYLYHFPQMSAVPYSDEVIERLVVTYPTVVYGVKDSSGDWKHMKNLVDRFPQLHVFAGTERYLLDILKAGGAGCISASANITCSLAAALYQVWESPGAVAMQDNLTRARLAIQAHPMIPTLKGLLSSLRKEPEWSHLRPPLVNVPVDIIEALYHELKKVNVQMA